MAGPGNNFGDGDKGINRPAESAASRVGDANTSLYTNKNGQDSLNAIRGQENRSAYPDSYAQKPQELSPKNALQNELKHLIPAGDNHKYTITLSREKNGSPHIDIAGQPGQSQESYNDFYNNVSLNCNENFWNNINKLTANGQKVSFSVGGNETKHAQKELSSTQATEHPAMQKMEPKLDTPKSAADTAKPKDSDSQIIDSKLANLIPPGVHLKFTQNGNQFNFTPDKYVDPQHWKPIEQAIQSNPDLVNAIMHKMSGSGRLDIASGHKPEARPAQDGHANASSDSPGVFKFKAAVNDLSGGAQAYGASAHESYEPMYLGGSAYMNGQEVRIDPAHNMPIPANAGDGYGISARVVQNSSGINTLQGYLHTEGNAKYFRVTKIGYSNGQVQQGQDLADIPLTKQNRNGVASY